MGRVLQMGEMPLLEKDCWAKLGPGGPSRACHIGLRRGGKISLQIIIYISTNVSQRERLS